MRITKNEVYLSYIEITGNEGDNGLFTQTLSLNTEWLFMG
jgi:hypothetical protein